MAEVALELQLTCEEPGLTASQEGQASNDVSADGAPLLAMALTSTCPLASVRRGTPAVPFILSRV